MSSMLADGRVTVKNLKLKETIAFSESSADGFCVGLPGLGELHGRHLSEGAVGPEGHPHRIVARVQHPLPVP